MTRYLLPALLCLACTTADSTGGLIGPPGPQGPQGEPGPKGDKGEPAPAARQLHLIVAETGEDLGLFISHTGIALNEQLGAPVLYGSQAQLLYPEPGCKGASLLALLWPEGLRHWAVRGPDGTLLQENGDNIMMRRRSAREGSGACADAELAQAAVPFVDTGISVGSYGRGGFAAEAR